MRKIKIAIADDSIIFRDGLKADLSLDPNLKIVLEARNGKVLLDNVEKVMPDVILMDLKMPVMDGLEATKEIRKKFKSIKVLGMTVYDDEKFIIQLMENGANGYLLKDNEPQEIRDAIYSVFENEYYINSIVSHALIKKLLLKRNLKLSFDQQIEFSERELEVLMMICKEKTASEIGAEIFLSPRSVEGIRQRLIDKVGVRSTAGLVIFAVKNGIV